MTAKTKLAVYIKDELDVYHDTFTDPDRISVIVEDRGYGIGDTWKRSTLRMFEGYDSLTEAREKRNRLIARGLLDSSECRIRMTESAREHYLRYRALRRQWAELSACPACTGTGYTWTVTEYPDGTADNVLGYCACPAGTPRKEVDDYYGY